MLNILLPLYSTLFFDEAYVKHIALSDQFWLQVFSHVLKFLSINFLAVFLINKLIPPLKKTKKTKNYNQNNNNNDNKCFKSGSEQL